MSSVYEKLKLYFGEEFAKKYLASKMVASEVPKEKIMSVAREAAQLMAKLNTNYVKVDNFDVILAETPADPSKSNVKQTSAGNWKLGMIFNPPEKLEPSVLGPWISVFVSHEADARVLAGEPEEVWILVGKLRAQEYGGGTTYSFRVAGYVRLGELFEGEESE